MIGLTARQLDLLRYVIGHVDAHGYGPSYSDINFAMGFKSNSGTARLLTGLEERGAIKRLPNLARAVTPTANVPIPRAPDGAPLFFVRIPQSQGGTQ